MPKITKVKRSTGECIVCGQICSGFHYGVKSCPACKSFFRRSIRMSYEYDCPRGENCDVAGEFRVACRACRLKKCFAVGMSESAMQNDRGRIKRTKRRQHGSAWLPSLVDPSANSNADSKTVGSLGAPKASFLQMLSMSLDLPADEALFNNVVANHKAFLEFAIDMHEKIVQTATDESAFFQIGMPDSPPSLTSCGTSTTESDLSEMSQLPTTTFEMALKQTETYLSTLPSCLREISCIRALNQDRKMTLLRNYMPRITLLAIMEASMASDASDCLVLMDGETTLRSNATPNASINEVLSDAMDDLLPRFRELNVDASEFACLRLLAFWCSEAVSSARTKKQMQRMQKIVLAVLRKHIAESSAGQAMKSLRYANILMLLGQVEAIGERLRWSLRSAAEKQEISVCPNGFLWNVLRQRKTSTESRAASEPAMPMDTVAAEEIDDYVRQFIREIELDSLRMQKYVIEKVDRRSCSPLSVKTAKNSLREFLLRKRSL